jgi:hypothetical protein
LLHSFFHYFNSLTDAAIKAVTKHTLIRVISSDTPNFILAILHTSAHMQDVKGDSRKNLIWNHVKRANEILIKFTHSFAFRFSNPHWKAIQGTYIIAFALNLTHVHENNSPLFFLFSKVQHMSIAIPSIVFPQVTYGKGA